MRAPVSTGRNTGLAEHGLGGIVGYDAKETGDEAPDHLAMVQRMTAAYLCARFEAGLTLPSMHTEYHGWTLGVTLKEQPRYRDISG